ncbi:hypothetical protein DXA83_13365 [Bacteroides thetaiotaomicron]|nr:hypothetical protein DXA83_13365 [Bacteroides thetaiotaomicron]
MELWQTYHEISKRFHLTADNWGVTKKSVVSQFSSFGKEEYPQGEVVGEYAVHLFTANYRQPYFTYHPGFQPPLLPSFSDHLSSFTFYFVPRDYYSPVASPLPHFHSSYI